jgi:serine phosphatase RsbU (regulator of sigma subunit)/Tfp pilus assembly protein PilF
MVHHLISAVFVASLTVVFSPEVVHGQSIDSLIYVIDNDLVDDEQDLLMKGEAYLDSGKLALALECFIRAASYYEKNNVDSKLGHAYVLMAETYNLQGNRENEMRYLRNAIKILEQEGVSRELSYAHHNLGYAYFSSGQYDSARIVYNRTLDLFNILNDTIAYFVCLGNLGLVHSRLSDLDVAEEYLLTAIDTLTRLDMEYFVPEFMIEYANILRQRGDFEHAVNYASRALEITDIPNYERDASHLLARLYEISGRYDSAYYYQSLFIVANDSIKNIESVQEMADLRTAYEVGRKQAEVDVLEKNKLIQTIIIIGLGIILILAIWLVTLYYTNLKRSRKFTRALEERNDEIVMANEELKQLNEVTSRQKDEIISSINYARRIQAAILPPETYFTELLNDSFILYKPRDIVSGDFYWIRQVQQYIILAAADCTGHGVPGAFMSMLGMSYLNEIVQRREITQANQVLNEMRRQIKDSLRQHGQPDEAKDGIDMALCVIDQKTRMIQYAGANNPLYIIQASNGRPKLNEIKPDRMPLGYYQGGFNTFTYKDIQLEYGDVIYLFSDGFIDQKGGRDNKKFMSRNFRNLLLKIHKEPMREQKSILDKTITDWMGNNPQIDDILVIGARV